MKPHFLAIISFLLMSCDSSKLEIPAYLSVVYYDKYDNRIEDASISFFDGGNQLLHYFEFKNENHTNQICNNLEKKITQNKEYFRLSHLISKLSYEKDDYLKLAEFNKISKIKFLCNVQTNTPNDECTFDKAKNIITKKMGGIESVRKLNKNQKQELMNEIYFELLLWNDFGLCNYRTLYISQPYRIEDLM